MAEAPRKHRSIWPFALGLAFCAHASIVFITMTFASRTPANAEPDYYEKALDWNETAAATHTPGREGWVWSVKRGEGSVSITITGPESRPIEGATITATALHRASPLDRTVLTMVETAPGVYTAPIHLDRRGLWDLHFHITTADGTPAIITETLERL